MLQRRLKKRSVRMKRKEQGARGRARSRNLQPKSWLSRESSRWVVCEHSNRTVGVVTTST